jgi:hypothetical protein
MNAMEVDLGDLFVLWFVVTIGLLVFSPFLWRKALAEAAE